MPSFETPDRLRPAQDQSVSFPNAQHPGPRRRPDRPCADGVTRPNRAGRVGPGLTLALPAVAILVGGWLHRWTNEDAYINLRVVEQIAAGNGPVFNSGERVEAFTSPLWLTVLVLIRATLGAVMSIEWGILVVTLILATAGFAIGARTTRRLHPEDRVVFPVGLLTIAAVPVVWDFATSGLEIALVWFWLAACWSVLVTAARTDAAPDGRRRLVALLVLGLGPVVRPDLGLMSVCFLAAWLLIDRPPVRRMVVDVLVAFAVSIAYQVFRMGYYASLIPSTALAKDARGIHLEQGIDYAVDLSRPYVLWIPLLLMAGLIVHTTVRSPSSVRVAVVAMAGAGLAHAAYMVVIGGDYMHGRLLLPALFAFALPAAVSWSPGLDRRRAVTAGVVVAVATVWAVSCAGWRRYENERTFSLAQISNFRDVSPRPLLEPRENDTEFWTGAEVAQAYERGERGTVRLLGSEVVSGGDPDELVVVLGSIGLAGYNAGVDVRVVDIGGLAEPLAARSDPIDGRPAGHRKQVDLAWYTAQFGVPGLEADPTRVAAAREALACAPLSDLLEAIDEPLTPGRFLSNVVHSFEYTGLRVPADPLAGKRDICGR